MLLRRGWLADRQLRAWLTDLLIAKIVVMPTVLAMSTSKGSAFLDSGTLGPSTIGSAVGSAIDAFVAGG